MNNKKKLYTLIFFLIIFGSLTNKYIPTNFKYIFGYFIGYICGIIAYYL